MTRLSRAEGQARTRETLVDTAKTLFLQDGYFATSLDKVAEAAGYSKGAVYSNFANKDELCLAVIDQIRTEKSVQVVAALTGAKTARGRLAAFERWAEDAIGDEGWSTLEVEFASQLRGDPELRLAFAERGRVIRGLLAQMISTYATETGVRLPMPAEHVAGALLSLGVGLGLQRAVDRELPVRILTDTIRVLAGLPVEAL